MNLEEAGVIFYEASNEDIDLLGNSPLLKKFISSWLTAVFEKTESVSFLCWYKKLFLNPDSFKANENSCIFAVTIFETLLDNGYLNSIPLSYNLFTQIILPLQDLIIGPNNIAKTDADIRIEVVLSFYRIYLKLSQNAEHAKEMKKYGLWKAVMLYYLKNYQLSIPIQNICTEYLNNLLLVECMPDEIFLFCDIISSNARLIKTSIEGGNYDDRILFLSLRLLKHVLLKNIPRLNKDAINLLWRKCNILQDVSLEIASHSKNVSVIKSALYLHALLKYCAIAGDETIDSQFLVENLIVSICDTLISPKFFKYVPDMLCLFEDIFIPSTMQSLWIYLRVLSINVYLQRYSLAVDLPDFSEFKTSEKLLEFLEKYQARLLQSSDLSEIVISILKLIQNSDSVLNKDGKNYFIYFMNSVLKSFVSCNKSLSNNLCNFLINIIHGMEILLMNCGIDQHYLDVLRTAICICRLDIPDRLDIKLAAYNLCNMILKRKTELMQPDIELLKHLMVDDLQDARWEVRDCVLEMLNTVVISCPKAFSDRPILDQQFFDIFTRTLCDSESYVRALAFKVLSGFISLPVEPPYINCESLILQTIAQFSAETEGNVRVNMILFIQSVWDRSKIINISSLMKVYELISFASSNDLSDEVRRSGMGFWEKLVHCFTLRNQSRSVHVELLDILGYIGCLQSVINALEDEYDVQVIEIASKISDFLLSISSLQNDTQREECPTDNATLPPNLILKNLLEIHNISPHFSTNLLPANHHHHYISGKEFRQKYESVDLKQIENDRFCVGDALNLNDLISLFKNVFFDSDINEKDCY